MAESNVRYVFCFQIESEESSVDGTEQEVTGLEQNMAAMMCSLQNKDDCLMCGS